MYHSPKRHELVTLERVTKSDDRWQISDQSCYHQYCYKPRTFGDTLRIPHKVSRIFPVKKSQYESNKKETSENPK